MADQVKIPGRQDSSANIFQLVCTWLQDLGNEKWILILDNVDDDEYLHMPIPQFSRLNRAASTSMHELERSQSLLPGKSPVEYLPMKPTGSIIITTRSKRVARNFVNECDIIPIEPLDAHAFSLLQRILPTETMPVVDDASLRMLAQELDCIALAVVQAATYIARRAPRCSVHQYLEMFRKGSRVRAELLKSEGRDIYRDRRRNNSIIVALQLSFEVIQETSPDAMDLLSLMSFFDRKSIPDYLLQSPSKINDWNESGSNSESDSGDYAGSWLSHIKEHETDTLDILDSDSDGDIQMSVSVPEDIWFEDSINTLKDYSLISIGPESHTFQMHGLIQFSTRDWLEAKGKIEPWKAVFLRNLYREFPKETNYANQAKSRILFPHVQRALAYGPNSNYRLRWARLISQGAFYANFSGLFGEARHMASVSRKEIQDSLGDKDSGDAIVACVFELNVLRACGNLEAAEDLCLQILESLYRDLQVTKDLFRQALESSPSEQPSPSQHAYFAYHSLYADILREQGRHRWTEAEAEYKKVWEMWLRDAPNANSGLNEIKSSLAELYQYQGRLQEAETMFEDVIKVQREISSDSPLVLHDYMKGLSSVYLQRDLHEKGIALLKEVVDKEELLFGPDHHRTLSSMRSLIRAYHTTDDSQQAILLMMDVFQRQTRSLGNENSETMQTLSLLIKMLMENEDFEAAECLAEMSIDVLQTNPSLVSLCKNKLAHIYRAQGLTKKAIDTISEVVETQKQAFGANNDTVIGIQLSLAEWLGEQGRVLEAEVLHRDIHKVYRKAFGKKHVKTLGSLQLLIDFYMRHELLAPAELSQMMSHLADSKTLVFGRESPDTLFTLHVLSVVYCLRLDRCHEAAELQQEILEICLRNPGIDFEPQALFLMETLATSWERTDRPEDSQDLRELMLACSTHKTSEETFNFLASSDILAAALRKSSHFLTSGESHGSPIVISD
jgi:tetratricopeptide (TPR) repeat protein